MGGGGFAINGEEDAFKNMAENKQINKITNFIHHQSQITIFSS